MIALLCPWKECSCPMYLASLLSSNVTIEKLSLNHHFKKIWINPSTFSLFPLSSQHWLRPDIQCISLASAIFFHWILGYMRRGTLSVLFTAVSLVLHQCATYGRHSLCSEYVTPQVKVVPMSQYHLLLASFMAHCRPQRHFVGNLEVPGTYLQTMT